MQAITLLFAATMALGGCPGASCCAEDGAKKAFQIHCVFFNPDADDAKLPFEPVLLVQNGKQVCLDFGTEIAAPLPAAMSRGQTRPNSGLSLRASVVGLNGKKVHVDVAFEVTESKTVAVRGDDSPDVHIKGQSIRVVRTVELGKPVTLSLAAKGREKTGIRFIVLEARDATKTGANVRCPVPPPATWVSSAPNPLPACRACPSGAVAASVPCPVVVSMMEPLPAPRAPVSMPGPVVAIVEQSFGVVPQPPAPVAHPRPVDLPPPAPQPAPGQAVFVPFALSDQFAVPPPMAATVPVSLQVSPVESKLNEILARLGEIEKQLKASGKMKASTGCCSDGCCAACCEEGCCKGCCAQKSSKR